MSQFELQTHLDRIYETTERLFTFDVTDPSSARAWQIVFRVALHEALKIDYRELPDDLSAEYIATSDQGTYIQDKYALKYDDIAIPMYLLIPKAEPPYKPIVAFHGHGMGANLILGNYANDPNADMYRANDENFAQCLAQDGYLVCVIEQQGFGERLTALTSKPEGGNSCRQLAFNYLLHNRTLLGERVWEGMLAISYLLKRNDILSDQLACVGFSGGGTTSLFLSAIDERIRKAVIMGYFCTLKQSILDIEHCECNYVPNLLTLGELSDIAGLIAPRSIHIISGENDPIFPIAGVHEQYDLLDRIYEAFGAEDKCHLSVHNGAHRPDYDLLVSGL